MAGPTVDKADKAAYQSNLDSYKTGHLKKEKTITSMLKAGDPAPRLAVGGWVQGGPITELSKGKVFLVEFWATWCGPCVASIPHLNELHLKFKDKGLVVIGQNVSEQDQAVVKPFVARMGSKMTYPVALDNVTESLKGSMHENWLNAAGQNGIPCAFLVAKDGKLAWIGYPSELTEKMVEDVLAGTFDASKVAVTAPSPEKNTPKSREEERAETWREFNDDIQKMNWDAAALLARKLSADEADPWRLLSLASGLLENESLRGEPLEAAYTMADKANQAMILGEDNRRGKARHLQVLARAAFMKDQRNKAITLLKEAIGLIDDPDGNSNYMSVLQSTLCDYKAGHLPKTIVDEVQPDEKNWALLRTGMSEREVVKLIGEPMQAKQANSGERVYVLQWGHVKYHSPCMPGGFAFIVIFANGKVERFGDPFGAPPSSDGIPTTPQPEFPRNGKAVHDIGRFVDYRWTPSSGKHPVSYDIEVQLDESFEPNKRIWGARSLFSVDLPHVSDTRPNQTFRWRVRAKDPLGASEWSQWQEVSERDIRTKTADAITSKSMPAPALSMRPQDARTDAIRVAKFKDDRVAALSFTLDDNMRDQYEVAVPLLNKYGIHATFFVIPGKTPETNEEAARKKPGDWGGISWPQLRELAAQGHEIANHTWMHTTLINTKNGKREDIPTGKLGEQVAKGYNTIKEKIGMAPLTFCAPGNGVDEAVRAMALKYHIAVREKNMQRFGDWPPTNRTFTAEQANGFVDRAITKGVAMIWMIHAITEGYNAVSSPDVLENHLKYVKSREDKLWVDTFANVSLYTLERDSAKLTQSISGNKATFTLVCPLDATKFNYPLTIVIPVRNAAQVKAMRSDSTVPFPVEVRQDRILVQAAPSPEQVVVTWQKTNGT